MTGDDLKHDQFSDALIELCIRARESGLDPAAVTGALLGSAAAETMRAGKGWSDFFDGLREQWAAAMLRRQVPRASECECRSLTLIDIPRAVMNPANPHHPSCRHYVPPDPLDVRGRDGVSERWKRQFIKPEVRQMADELLAARYPQLDSVFRAVVEWASLSPELAGVTFDTNWIQLHYRLGPAHAALMLTREQVTQAVARPFLAPIWQERIQHTLLALRLGRAEHELMPKSTQELEAQQRLEHERRERREGREP